MTKPRTQFVIGIGELALAGAFVLFAIGVAVTAAMHALEPSRWGLWAGPGQFFFGTADDLSHCRELLGSRIFPVAGLTVLLAGMVTRDAWHSARPRIRGAWRKTEI